MAMSSSMAVAMVLASDTGAPPTSKVSDTGRSKRSARAPAGCLVDKVSDTGGPIPLVSDTASASNEPASGSGLDPQRDKQLPGEGACACASCMQVGAWHRYTVRD